MKAYFDRIEDKKIAVLIMEENKQQVTIPIEDLPPDSKPGTWFHITLENGKITSIVMDEATTIEKQKSTEDLMTMLRNKKNGSKFKKN